MGGSNRRDRSRSLDGDNRTATDERNETPETDDADGDLNAPTEGQLEANALTAPTRSRETQRAYTDGGRPTSEEPAQATRADPLVAAYRHDVHKMRGRTHANAAATYREVPVNERVPLGADRDAAVLSRPAEPDGCTLPNHTSPYRLSLLTGDAVRTRAGDTEGIRPLIDSDDAELLHARWLVSSEAAIYNETVYHPYTSLKGHTLLTAALLDAYRAGHDFSDLWLAVTPTAASDSVEPEHETTDSEQTTPPANPTTDAPTNADETAGTRVDVQTMLDSDVVIPHQTVLWTPQFTLRLTPTPNGYPAAPLGAAPARSFADVWSRLPSQPLPVEQDRQWRVLDAQLRRIRAWSTALQYIEDFLTRFGEPLTDTSTTASRPTTRPEGGQR